jgi:hypothetical protein
MVISVLMAAVLALGLLVGCGVQQEEVGSIEGTITDSEGEPVVGMRVCIVSGTTGFPEISAQTNEQGYYQIGSVPTGTFEVAVHDREGNSIDVQSAVVDGGDISTLNFVIEKPKGALTVAKLLENPVYDTQETIFGTVSLLGEVSCSCFRVTSGKATVEVWYDLMTENDGTTRPPVDVTGINNGDTVVITGEIKGEGGTYYNKGDFWANSEVDHEIWTGCEESQQIALDFLKQSPTFAFDGIEDSIKLVRVEPAFCPNCWGFVYAFQCAHPGYGDRTGQILAQVITDHEAMIGVSMGEVDGGTINRKWDMVHQQEISGQPPIIKEAQH